MITVAFDTATDRCSVAATDGDVTEVRSVDGARRHAGAILGMIADALATLGVAPSDVRRIVTANGPGSFTGLRVAASVAKALTWHRDVEWRTTPSLLARAAAHAPADGGRVLALSDALRGELFAGCWQLQPGRIDAVGSAPRAMAPQALAQFGGVDVVVGSIPLPLVAAVSAVTGVEPIVGDVALPDARTLLWLAGVTGGTTVVGDPARWEPDYGRPAEAQAVWERTHGRPLDSATDRAG